MAQNVESEDSCEDPPKLNRLQQSSKDASNAEVVYTNCTVVKISSTSSNGTTTLDASNLEIQEIYTFPDVTTLVVSGNSITTIDETSYATVQVLDLSSNGLSGLDDLAIPGSVNRLVLDGNSIISLADGEVPDSVTTLSLKKNGIVSLNNFAFSKTVVGLDTSDNTIHDLSKWNMPTQLQAFTCQECNVTLLSGVGLPTSASLTSLDLTGSTIRSFEVANSTIPLLLQLSLFELTVSSSTCDDLRATKKQFQSVPTCVLPDAVFKSKYVLSGSQSDESLAPMPPANGTQSVNDITSGKQDPASASWMMVAMISGAALLLMLIGGAVGYLVFSHRRTYKFEDYEEEDGRLPGFHSVVHTDVTNGNDPSTDTVTRSIHTATTRTHSETLDTIEGIKPRRTSAQVPISGRHLDNDIRTDKEMRHFRLMYEEVERGKLLAKGGYGAIYLASFRHKMVVMKQLLPDRARDYRMLNNFMDEIRVCASLDHPKIVTFIGFTFTSLMDLSAVMEYMPHGDLSTLLQKQHNRENRDPVARDSFGWFRSMATERGGLKCKSLVALDIAEAMVYLHSFESPMIHRDLKTNNVLLSEKWEAKLTDFGVSRELTEDHTMTAEIGTVAWIAPEVLRGERYSEKADVYSFGVIMTELDTCQRPYSEGIPSEDSRVGKINQKHTNTRIAVLVSAGTLRPSLSSDCPPSVRDLAEKCLDSDPDKRPSAVQLHFELRNLDLAIEDLATSGRVVSRRMSAPRKVKCRPPRRAAVRKEYRQQSESQIKDLVLNSERGTRPTTKGGQPSHRGEQPSRRVEQPSQRGELPSKRGGRLTERGVRLTERDNRPISQRREQPSQRGVRLTERGERFTERTISQRGELPSQRGVRLTEREISQRGDQPSQRGVRLTERGVRLTERDGRPTERGEHPTQRGTRPTERREFLL